MRSVDSNCYNETNKNKILQKLYEKNFSFLIIDVYSMDSKLKFTKQKFDFFFFDFVKHLKHEM